MIGNRVFTEYFFLYIFYILYNIISFLVHDESCILVRTLRVLNLPGEISISSLAILLGYVVGESSNCFFKHASLGLASVSGTAEPCC